ncbi:squalene/phytoene synthase family protein, partial [Streptomyces sp. NPDC004561]
SEHAAAGRHPVSGALDRRSGACVAAMAGIYRRLLDRIERDPEAVLRGRVSLPGREKAYVAVRGLSGLDTRHVTRHTPGRSARRRA